MDKGKTAFNAIMIEMRYPNMAIVGMLVLDQIVMDPSYFSIEIAYFPA
jgi:hypothetical protein